MSDTQAPQIQAKMAPIEGSTPQANTVIYYSATPHMSIHRRDGKRLIFAFNYLATNIKEDIKFLDSEIEDGHPYFRHADEYEQTTYRQRTDPRKEMEHSIRETMEPVLRAELEAQIREEMEAKAAGESTSVVSDEKKIGGVDALSKLRGTATTTDTARITPVSSSALIESAGESNSK